MRDNINNLKIKKDKTYITYTLLFCAICFFVFLAFIIHNKSFVWQDDGIKQHFVILYDFNQIVRNMLKDGIPMLSWNMGLGLDVIGQYSYYVIGDPFAYISLLFPMEKLEIAYNILILLRIYCVGISFIIYCKYTKKENINMILGAIIYTFCGFILYAGIRHPYFTNAVILLPLNLLGIEKLLRENKKIFFIFIIFISAVSNYYFFYMITIISIIYGITKYIFQYNKGAKEFFRKAGNAILCYIVGILMAGAILLPTVYAFLNSARTECEQVSTYINGFYKFLFMGIISIRFKNWTVIGVSSIVLIMIPILITKLKDKEVKTFLSLLLTTTAMLLFPQIASMMNGFSFPSNRWIFAYSFILSYIVTICFDKNFKYSKKQKIYMLLFLLIYTVIGIYITKFNIKKNLDFYVLCALPYLIFMVIAYRYKKEKNIRIANYIIILLVAINIVIISASLYFKYGNGYVEEFIDSGTVEEKCGSVNGKIKNFKDAIEYIKENDKDFYRVSKKEVVYNNLSLMYEYNPIQLFLSLGNESVYKLSGKLEDNCYSSTQCVNGVDRRTKYMTLLANKYYICDKEDVRYVPYGYALYHKIEDTLIYINENYLSAGVIYDSYITKEQFEELSPLEKEDSLITSAMIEAVENTNITNSETTKIDKPINLNYTVKQNKIINNSINITKDKEIVELVISDIPKESEIYLSINNLRYESENHKTDFKITAKLDGITNNESVKDCISSAYYMENPNFLMNLGVTDINQDNKLKLTFSRKGIYTFDDFEILAVSMNKYEEKINKLKTNVLDNISYGNNYIKGTVNSANNGILQITTSFSDGWKAYVDNKEVEVFKVNEAFIGINIEEGKHNVRFEYETPYLNFGTVLSFLGIFSYIIIIIIEKNKRSHIFK